MNEATKTNGGKKVNDKPTIKQKRALKRANDRYNFRVAYSNLSEAKKLLLNGNRDDALVYLGRSLEYFNDYFAEAYNK